MYKGLPVYEFEFDLLSYCSFNSQNSFNMRFLSEWATDSDWKLILFHSFVRSFVRSFIHSIIHSFIHSFIFSNGSLKVEYDVEFFGNENISDLAESLIDATRNGNITLNGHETGFTIDDTAIRQSFNDCKY